MKKTFLGLAAMALIFASCAKDEVTSINTATVNPNAIGFEMGTGKVTRGTSNTLATLETNNNTFGVYATHKSTKVQFFENLAYKYSATTKWGWDGSDKEWPTVAADYPIHFYAYYPKAKTTLLATTLTQAYSVEDNVANQIDYLAAKKTDVTQRPADSKVTLDFKHIMSKVDFQVSAGAGATVLVQSIKVMQVWNAATFNYNTFAWTAPTGTNVKDYPYMVAPAKTDNKFVNNTTSAAAAAAVTGDNGSMILLPQSLSAKAWPAKAEPVAQQSYIEVVYRVTETATDKDLVGYADASKHPDFATLGNGENELFVKVGYSLPTEWLMSKAYTYVLHLGDTNYTGGNLTDDTFTDEDGNDTDLPVVDPNNPDEEKNIPETIYDQGNVIGFTVKVSDFESTAGIDLP